MCRSGCLAYALFSVAMRRAHGIEPGAAGVEMGKNRLAHPRVPELLDVLGDARNGLVIALTGEEFSDLVGHINQAVRRHAASARLSASDVIRSGCAKISKPSARAIAASVIPAASAIRTANAVGADTATISGAPIAAVF